VLLIMVKGQIREESCQAREGAMSGEGVGVKFYIRRGGITTISLQIAPHKTNLNTRNRKRTPPVPYSYR